MDSPLGDLVTQIIPGDWDDNLKAKASEALGKAVDVLDYTNRIASTPELEDKLKLFITGLYDQSSEFRESQLKKTMDLITAYLDNNKLKTHEYEAATMGTFITTVK